jgi:hypothetical protein
MRNTAQMSGTATTEVPTPGGTSAAIKSEYSDAKNGRVTGKSATEAPTARATSVLNWSAAIVLAGVALLWMLGGIVFKDANI